LNACATRGDGASFGRDVVKAALKKWLSVRLTSDFNCFKTTRQHDNNTDRKWLRLWWLCNGLTNQNIHL
jgi:hypothetical protein